MDDFYNDDIEYKALIDCKEVGVLKTRNDEFTN